MTTPEGESQDVTIDLRNLQTPETNEIFSDFIATEAVKKIIIIGVAARHSEIDILRMHWSNRHQIYNEPLQEVALESLRDAAIAGIDRLDGKYDVPTVAHSVFDQLYGRSEDTSHAAFIERLSWISQSTWKLLNFHDFELTPVQENTFRDNQQHLMLTADDLFQNFFYKLAQTDAEPDKYAKLIDTVLGQDVAEIYLDKKYIISKLRYLRSTRTIHKDVEPETELQFYEWMLQQEQRLRLRKLGAVATSDPT